MGVRHRFAPVANRLFGGPRVGWRASSRVPGNATTHSIGSQATFRHGNWNNLVDPETQKFGPKLEDIRQRWHELGIIDINAKAGQTSLIFYCGTGWRSSVSFLISILLGIPAKNYDSGFYGWSWNRENEIHQKTNAGVDLRVYRLRLFC